MVLIGQASHLGQGHQHLWFLTVTAVTKPENLPEMKNRHCGETIVHPHTCQAQVSTCSLPPRCGCTAEGMMAGEGLSTHSQTGWSDPKSGGMGSTCLCGQLCEAETTARSKQGTGDVTCVNLGWKALKHENLGRLWGFILLNSWLWLCIYNPSQVSC